LHYKSVQRELRKAKDLLERSKSVSNVKDKVSRAYYACFHVAVSAIWLKADFTERGTTHENMFNQYRALYTKTKGTHITSKGNVFDNLKKWKKLREKADYVVFDKLFDSKNRRDTSTILKDMYDFVAIHIAHIEKALLNSQEET